MKPGARANCSSRPEASIARIGDSDGGDPLWFAQVTDGYQHTQKDQISWLVAQDVQRQLHCAGTVSIGTIHS